MTNSQIIATIAAEIYGEDTVNRMIESGEEIPLHTLKGWQARGSYRVRKGEHGIETKLWKRRKGKDGEENNTAEENGEFVLVKSYLFRSDQIEKVES